MNGINTTRLQSLLAYLLLHRHTPQSRSHLAFLFWPDSTEAQAHTNLRNLLHRLRHALPEADSFLEVDAHTVQWRAGVPFTLDVASFESASALADQAERAGDQPALQAALEQAVALYQGDLLPSCYDDWILPERERLSQAFIGALERLSRLLEGQRDYQGAIRNAQHLLRHDPLRETTYRRLMRLHALSGDRAGALRAYHACATILQRELAVGPSPATHEAYERLLQMDALPAPAPVSSLEAVPLVGRAREWAQLQGTWRTAAAEGPRFVLLDGEAGIGKTRLAEELIMWAARQGIATASARCYAAEGRLAYAPVATWLRARPLPPLADVWLTEVARLLPELLAERPDLPPPGPLAEAWQHQRLFEALARALLRGSQPLLLSIDDLHWCDRETLEWLHYLLRFDPQARLLVVGTLCADDVAADHPLVPLLEALRRSEQLTEITLAPLNEAETLPLAEGVAGRTLDPALAGPLYQGSEGNPLFVVEMVRAGLSRGGPWSVEHEQRMAHATLPLLPKVRVVIEARLSQLSPPARELAGLAAVIGREFTFPVLAQASDADESALVRGLDELWRRRIVHEQGADAYDFVHDRFREAAYSALSLTWRRWLHRRVALALEALHAADLDAVSPQVAFHYEQAGQPERAIAFYQRAATAARAIYSNGEALRHYRRALALLAESRPGHQTPDEERQTAAPLYEGLGDVLALTGQQAEAGDAYQQALNQAPGQDGQWQARLHRKRGSIWEAQRRHEEALLACDRAETALGPEPAEAAADWWQEWVRIQTERVWVHSWQGHLPELMEVVTRTRAVAQRVSTLLECTTIFWT